MAFEGWNNMVPPGDWERVLAMDVGGATNNALEFGAIDPHTKSLVMYDEIHKISTDMRELAELCKPKMMNPETGVEYKFQFRTGDYENRVALDEMGRNGVRFTNAVKHDKLLSVQRLSGYLHPNPKRPYPAWHPKAGQPGAPLLFLTAGCPQLAKEIPIQRWKEAEEGSEVKDEMDRGVKHDCVDALLYIVRLLPASTTIAYPKVAPKEDRRSLMSKLYWQDVKRMEQLKKEQLTKSRTYNPAHASGGIEWKFSR